jgi:hypothetical protein
VARTVCGCGEHAGIQRQPLHTDRYSYFRTAEQSS